jgi:hypothetical protein
MAGSKPMKEADGKPAFDLLFSCPIDEVAKVFTHGEKKYPRLGPGQYNWRQAIGLDPKERREYVEKLLAAAIRHINAEFGAYLDQKSLTVDEESDLPHLAHACANLLMAMDILE